MLKCVSLQFNFSSQFVVLFIFPETEGLKSPNLTAPRLQSDTALQRPESIGSGSRSSSSSGRGSLSPSGFRENQVHENGQGTQIPRISPQNNSHGTS